MYFIYLQNCIDNVRVLSFFINYKYKVKAKKNYFGCSQT